MFKIATKHDPKSGKGIYAIAKPVKKYADIEKIVDDMVPWLNENNGKFPEPYPTAYAISHCQVADEPYAMFVVSRELLGTKRMKTGRNTYKNYFFPSQVILNAEILEAPDKIEAKIPKRELVKDANGKVTGTKIDVKEGQVTNKIFVPDACMSFTHRTSKNTERFYRIKVRYQIVRKVLGIPFLKTITEVCEGLKAHIFQHEIDHAHGKNMYYSNK